VSKHCLLAAPAVSALAVLLALTFLSVDVPSAAARPATSADTVASVPSSTTFV
jgi:hypothetical protein